MIIKREEKKKLEEIKKPTVIAGFVGVGNVGKMTLDYLASELKAEKILEIYTDYLPHIIFLNNNGKFTLPKIEFYKKRIKKRDFLLVTSSTQPAEEKKSYKFSMLIFKEVLRCNPKEIITVGGYGVQKPQDPPRVYGITNSRALKIKFSKKGVVFDPERIGTVVGAAGLLVGYADLEGIPSICLLGETSLEIGLKAVKAVLSVLDRVYGFGINFGRIDRDIELQEKQLKESKLMEEMRKRAEIEKFFVDLFERERKRKLRPPYFI